MTQPRLVGGRYELGELIGYGGMAEVHRGRDIRLGRDVAIKVLRADLARDPSFLNRFRREAQSAAGLNHPSIVSVYDTGEDVGAEGTSQPYIVMEYVQGRTLRDILKSEGRLPARRAMEIIADVCAALDFSHHAGLVHRDVKPANVMITRAGAVKVMDFGIARAVADSSATVTQTANVIGTAQYLSPEQARGEAVDARSDVYSTGCLLYELVTGNPPFQGDSPVAVAYQHVRENATAPSSRVAEIPRALDSIVMKALAKNPQNRYQSAGEMRTDLQRALADQPVAAETVMTDAERTQFIARTPPPVAPVPVPTGFPHDSDDEHRNGLVWAAIVVALLLVIGAGGFFVYRLSNTSDSPKMITVADVIGLSPDAASTKLGNKAGCTTTDTCVINLLPATTVTAAACNNDQTVTTAGLICTLSYDPASSQTVELNASVKQGTDLYYQTYKKPTTYVPYVEGSTYPAAITALQKVQLVAKQGKSINTFDTPAGEVVSTSPPYNTPLSPGDVVTVYLSTGKQILPDLRGQSAPAAKTLLDPLWTTVKLQKGRATSDIKKRGIVYDMDPSPKFAYPADRVITLTYYHYVKPAPTCDSNTTAPAPNASTSPSGSTSGATSGSPSGSPGGSSSPTLPACTTSSAPGSATATPTG